MIDTGVVGVTTRPDAEDAARDAGRRLADAGVLTAPW